jgi:hypothetical protein
MRAQAAPENGQIYSSSEGAACARNQGTCEQYFAEIKSELDLERLPSGKFVVNELFFQLGMFVMNMLRVIGLSLLGSSKQTMMKAMRQRLRTVIQNIMYLSNKVI